MLGSILDLSNVLRRILTVLWYRWNHKILLRFIVIPFTKKIDILRRIKKYSVYRYKIFLPISNNLIEIIIIALIDLMIASTHFNKIKHSNAVLWQLWIFPTCFWRNFINRKLIREARHVISFKQLFNQQNRVFCCWCRQPVQFFFSGAPLWIDLSVGMSVCLSHFFWKPYSTYVNLYRYTDVLIKYFEC